MKSFWSNGSRVALITLLAPIAWGTTYVTITELLPPDRPLFVAAIRVIPAGLVLLAAGSLARRTPPTPRNWRQLAVLSLFNFGLFFPLLIVAIYRVPGGVAASVGGIQPLLVALAGWALMGTRPRRFDILLGIGAGIGVAMVVIRPGASIEPSGVIAALAANTSFSIGVVLTKKYNTPGDRLTGTGLQLLLSTTIIVPLAVLIEGSPPSMSIRNISGIIYLSLIATGAAFLVWFNGIQRLPSQAPPVLGLAAPITGATLGWILLNESLSPIQLAGFAITIGVITYAASLGATETPPKHTHLVTQATRQTHPGRSTAKLADQVDTTG